MLHPSTALGFVDATVGHGVFATAPIPRGTIVWTLDPLDQIIAPEERARLDDPLRALIDRYAFRDGQDRLVLCWDHARFVNHSCDANCLGPAGLSFEVAVRDIAPGEQLTDDYRGFGLEDPFPCACGASGCQGLVAPQASPEVESVWRRKLRASLAEVFAVPQALLPVLWDQGAIDRLWDEGPEALLDPAPTPRSSVRAVAVR